MSKIASAPIHWLQPEKPKEQLKIVHNIAVILIAALPNYPVRLNVLNVMVYGIANVPVHYLCPVTFANVRAIHTKAATIAWLAFPQNKLIVTIPPVLARLQRTLQPHQKPTPLVMIIAKMEVLSIIILTAVPVMTVMAMKIITAIV